MSEFEIGFAVAAVVAVIVALVWMRGADHTPSGEGDPTEGDLRAEAAAEFGSAAATSAPAAVDISQTSFMGATARVWSLEPRPPRQPKGSAEWAALVDTTYDGRLSDQQLLYLEALLRDAGIATVFVPWRPQEHYGIVGPQYPLALFVDARRLEDAVQVREDLLGDGHSFTYQLRLADPLVNIPSYRLELISAQATFRQLADFDMTTKVLALIVVAIGMLPGLGATGGVGLLSILLAPRLVVRYRRAIAEASSSEDADAADPADEEPRAEEDQERGEHAHHDPVDPR